MFDFEENRSVVNGAIAIVVVADRAVKLMIPENVIEGLTLRCLRSRRRSLDLNAINRGGSASPHELAVQLHHARIAGLDGAELRMVADLRNGDPAAIDGVDQVLPRLDLLSLVVHEYRQGSDLLYRLQDASTCNMEA